MLPDNENYRYLGLVFVLQAGQSMLVHIPSAHFLPGLTAQTQGASVVKQALAEGLKLLASSPWDLR